MLPELGSLGRTQGAHKASGKRSNKDCCSNDEAGRKVVGHGANEEQCALGASEQGESGVFVRFSGTAHQKEDEGEEETEYGHV